LQLDCEDVRFLDETVNANANSMTDNVQGAKPLGLPSTTTTTTIQRAEPPMVPDRSTRWNTKNLGLRLASDAASAASAAIIIAPIITVIDQ